MEGAEIAEANCLRDPFGIWGFIIRAAFAALLLSIGSSLKIAQTQTKELTKEELPKDNNFYNILFKPAKRLLINIPRGLAPPVLSHNFFVTHPKLREQWRSAR